MIIVLIHWKIHPHEQAREEFFKYWKETLTIDERSHLVGEYLSTPLTASEAGFQCSIFGASPSEKYASYFNVGIWESKEAFERQIIQPYVTSKPQTKTFEYEFRDRMVLAPASWRAGNSSLPSADHFASK